ncbi:cell division protein FtsA [Bacteroidota bacterium]|jgi:cell division protein FtsA|nr:cell division protein FtsA [Balneolaceae bacterium]MDA0735782.1 cell division protein FtsA [Bacteroidota bacterium]PDH56887.1 MAG: cell division protein FtsA [Rhodothermaeota bacterium MED-G12]MBL6916107.1 cell division protein FtsA [Balneolaceae bacterium]MCH1551989.1 cell division protein FtsA [Balneolaceae bacterium]|tara:strand:- start:4582 stop:5841 length:1260 start_codon:yes stop_codon:yes gene_type:complete
MTETERIMVGLDIGTTKICAIVASIDEQERINILGVGKAPSDGLNRGVVVNIDKTVNAIKEAIAQAELASGIQVNSVNVGIAGDHIRSMRSKGVITINNRDNEITAQDVERLLEDCQRIMLPTDQQILHVIPQEFVVDGQDGISDPVGMSGMRMEAEVHIITGLVSAAKNIYRCVERAGYQVADIILEPLASSYSALDAEEKEAGVVLVDIGGGTTDVAIFQESTIRHTAVIAVAGQKVTDDIRIGLSVLDDQAESLKRKHGESYADLIQEDEVITVPGIAGRPPKEITKSILGKIIQARMEEILEIVGIEIKRSGYSDALSAGVVLTGGGSLVKNICPLANESLGMDAKIGLPLGITGGLVEEVNSPIYATAVGLVIHALKTGMNNQKTMIPASSKATSVEQVMNKIADRMKGWFKEL